MQRTSELYRTLLADPLHRKEVRVSAAGTVYGQGRIVSMTTSGGLFANDTLDIGGAAAREIDLTLFLDHSASVPKMAELRPACRLVRDAEASEWLPKGVFYIDSRDEEQIAGGRLLILHGFDAMLKAEQEWVPEQSLEFPMTMPAAAAEIARLMGVELDGRTRLNAAYLVDYPANGYTLRDVLRFIAAAHAGNWIITDEGRLLLVPLVAGTGDTADMGQAAGSLELGLAFDPVSGVVVMVDDDNCYEAGDDSGKVLEITCPYGSQAMAQALLAQLRGYTYQPMQAADALLDPAAELGDLVSCCGVTTVLAYAEITFDQLLTWDISAPGQREMSSEYPYQSSAVKELSRKIASTRSEIAKTSEQIRLAVETVNAETAKLAEFNITVDKISSTVQDASGRVSQLEQTVEGFNTRISATETGLSGANTHISQIEQYAKSIKLSVINGETSSTFQLTAGSTTLSSGEIKFTGFVTFAGLSGGTTTIDGACIKTGTISADRIDVSALKVSAVYTTDYKWPAIHSAGAETLHIGGDGSYNFQYTNIYASRYVRIGSGSSAISSTALMIDTVERCIRSVSSTSTWSVGSSAVPMENVFCKSLTVGTTTLGILTSPTTIRPALAGSTVYSCGTESQPFTNGYFTNLYINKTKFDPSSCVTTSTLTDTLKSYATTAALADYAKPGAVYRLYAGGTSTTYLLTYNSSRQLVPSHTGSSYGSSIGTSASPFYTGYFANLYVNGTAVTPGSYLTSHQSLTDYAKTTAIYRLYAGGTSTTYLLTYNSSRQLVPSHTGSSYGSSIGTSTYPFYWGYFTNLTIQAGTIALGTSAAKLGFFGATAVTRKTVAAVSTSGTLANAITGINNLITALKGYGLIS